MVLIVDAAFEVQVLSSLRKSGEIAMRIGTVRAKAASTDVGVVLNNLDAAFA